MPCNCFGLQFIESGVSLMARRIFISFMGIGSYKPVTYSLDGLNASPTRFAQRAILEILQQRDASFEIDDVCVLTTSTACERYWDPDQGLRTALNGWKENYPHDVVVRSVAIPDPSDVESVWQIFGVLYHMLEQAAAEAEDGVVNVLFDITHSFRSLPMLTMLVLHFAKAVLDVNVEAIFYGSYEPNRPDRPETPILDLRPFSELQDWITGAQLFLEGGQAKRLLNLTTEQTKRANIENNPQSNVYSKIKDITANWDELLNAIQVSYTTETRDKAGEVKHLMDGLKLEQAPHDLLPIKVLLDKVREEVNPLAQEDELLSGLAAIEWCARHRLVQQAYTMLRELIVTLTCLRYDLEPKDRRARLKVEKGFPSFKQRAGAQPGEDACREPVSDITKSVMSFAEGNPELCKLWGKIIQPRNDMNHAGMTFHPMRVSKLASSMDVQGWRAVLESTFAGSRNQ